MSSRQPVAIVFDTFGTVVDWRTSLITELTAFGAQRGISADWTGLVDAWRAAYHPSMDRVRKGELPWTRLDDLLGGGIHVLVGADFELCGEVLAAAKRLGAKVARIVSARAVQATSAEDAPVLVEESDLFVTWMAQRNGKALVARPDHAVFGMATTGEELVRVLQTLGLRLGV